VALAPNSVEGDIDLHSRARTKDTDIGAIGLDAPGSAKGALGVPLRKLQRRGLWLVAAK
jgi:hypothetical protein